MSILGGPRFMYMVRIGYAISFVFLACVLFIPAIEEIRTAREITKIVVIPFLGIGLVATVAAWECLSKRNEPRGASFRWAFLASLLTLVMFLIFGGHYLVQGGVSMFLSGERIFAIPQILAALGLFLFYPSSRVGKSTKYKQGKDQ